MFNRGGIAIVGGEKGGGDEKESEGAGGFCWYCVLRSHGIISLRRDDERIPSSSQRS